MPPSVVNSQTLQCYDSAGPATLSLVCGGANRCLFVSVSWCDYGGTVTISAITFNGVAMTLVKADDNTLGIRLATYKLLNPPTGANTLSVTFSGVTFGTAEADAWQDVDQTTPNGSVTTSYSTTNATPSTTLASSTSGNVVRAAANLGQSTWNYAAGQTLVNKLISSGYSIGVQQTAAGGSKTMTWTGETNPYVQHVFEINAVPPAPTNSIAPAITGTVQVGQVLTCSNGTWTSSPTSYSKQWKRADDSGFTTNVTNIGTDSSTFTLTASELGKYVRCTVTATNAGGSTAANSNVVGTVLPAAPVANFTGTPTSGTASLSVAFTDSSTNTPTSWLWEKNSGGGWVNFASTPTSQNPTESFAAGTWSVRLTATNAGGSDTKTRTDYITATQPIPVNTVAPAVTPSPATVGQACSCTTGTWTGSPTSYSYQWKLDGGNVGTNGSSYTPVAAGTLTCTVTASNAGGAGTPAVSNSVTVSAAASGVAPTGNPGLKSGLAGIRSQLGGL